MLIHTPRLIIRDYEQADIKDFYAIFSDPEVMRYCDAVYTWEQCERWIAYFRENPIAFAVEERASHRVVGHVLFKQLPGEAEGIYEIGWNFARAYWRQGMAYEAGRALIEYGFETLRLHKLMAETIDGVRAKGLMEKLGMRCEGVFRSHMLDRQGQWADVYWYALLNEQ